MTDCAFGRFHYPSGYGFDQSQFVLLIDLFDPLAMVLTNDSLGLCMVCLILWRWFGPMEICTFGPFDPLVLGWTIDSQVLA